MTNLAKLLEISESVSTVSAELTSSLESLSPIYSSKNGMLAFEASLIILPTQTTGDVPSLREWNDPTGWRSRFNAPDDIVFFGMDAFAGQFGISSSGIVRLEPESGVLSFHATDLETWAAKILNDYDYETGFSVAHEWQIRHGPLGGGVRLLPKRPFILGGEYSAENMTPWPLWDAMEQLSNLHEQVSDVPDGQPIRIHGWLVPKPE